MAKQNDRGRVPSPLLSLEQVDAALVDGLGGLSLGGVIGARARGFPGRAGGASGARFGARHLTRLDGEQRVLRVERFDAGVDALRAAYFDGDVQEQVGAAPGSTQDAVMMVGMVGSGAARMNPCVVQVVWFADRLLAVAHAREGLIKQHTCARALQRLGELLAPVG